MKYFLDNDVSPRFASMLQALDVDITPLRDVYPANTPDATFLKDLQESPYDVFISNNSSQRRIPQEAMLLKASGLTCLYFCPFWSKLAFWPQAIWLVRHWQKIEGFCQGVARGTCADLQQQGTARVCHF